MTTSTALKLDLDWLEAFSEARIKHYLEEKTEPLRPDLPTVAGECSYAGLVKRHQLAEEERLLLILALAPYLRPQSLDCFRIQNTALGSVFTEFGGVRGKNHAGFLPTGETALFLLAGNDHALRLKYVNLFHRRHRLFEENLLEEVSQPSGEPLWSGLLAPSTEVIGELVMSERSGHFDPKFPAREIRSEMTWDDLVLADSVRERVDEIRGWIQHGDVVSQNWGLGRVLRPGYRALFYGPPGTGKTITASLIGQTEGLKVFRVDLSAIVSKYIGETEKNLSQVFDRAENKRWILFFDEADALFGKRTETESSHDRYANQEVAYLLQRMETFRGVLILATNLHNNLDDAFSRRFENVVFFPEPSEGERLELWRTLAGKRIAIDPNVDFLDLATRFELTGGQIVNVLRHAALVSAMRGRDGLFTVDLHEGIRREYIKEGLEA